MNECHIDVSYGADDDGYIADIPDLTGCSAFGATPEEAVVEANRARTLVNSSQLDTSRASMANLQASARVVGLGLVLWN